MVSLFFTALFLKSTYLVKSSSSMLFDELGNVRTCFILRAKLYIPSSPNIDFILWHTQLIVCAEYVKSWFKSWVFPFTFQAYILPHTLDLLFCDLDSENV